MTESNLLVILANVSPRARSVKDARAVEVHFQAQRVRVFADFVDAFGGVDRAAGHVAGIFQADERGLRVVINFGPNDRFDLLPGHDAVFAARTARGMQPAMADMEASSYRFTWLRSSQMTSLP